MAKTNAPLLAFGARGQIAGAHVYASWRGVRYARRYVVPGNPRTTEQMITRNCFAGLNLVYKLAPPLITAPWDAYAAGKPLTGRNGFVRANLPGLRGQTDLTAFTFSAGARGGLPPAGVSVTPGSGQLTIAVTGPSAPSGWSIDAAVAAVIRDQDPETWPDPNTFAGEDTSSPYSIVITGLATGQLYRVGAWLRWMKPDGTFAYSPATMTTGTPS